MPRYDCLLFDADNTLFDFDLAQKQSLENAVKGAIGFFDAQWLETYAQISNSYWDRFEAGTITVEQLKQRRFEDFTETLQLDVSSDRLNQSYISNLSQCAMLVENCDHVITTLAKTGVKLVVVTNGLSIIQRPRLKAASFTPHFESIIISDEIGIAKPDPRIFQAAMDSVDASTKSKTLMVGDSLKSDIRGGIDFGIDTCWFNPNRNKNNLNFESKYEIQRLEQILDIVL